MNHIPNNIIRQVLLLLAIILLAVILFFPLQSYLPSLLGAYTLFVLLKKWMYILTGRYKWRKAWAAGFLMFMSFLIILLPVVALINMVSSKINFAIQHSSTVIASIESLIHQYELRYHIQIIQESYVRDLTAWSAGSLQKLVGATFNGLITIVFTYFILYFMLIGGRKMETYLIEWIPMKNENVKLMRQETNSLVYSNAIGIPLIALLQGLLGLIAYLLLGINEPIFWFVITCISSMLPVVGASLAYVPVALLLFASGMNIKGVIMLAYGFGVISTVDSVFRFWLQKKLGDVHPLITAFGVILGLNLFGFIGLIFGPILISMFLLLVRIYINEFSVNKIT